MSSGVVLLVRSLTVARIVSRAKDGKCKSLVHVQHNKNACTVGCEAGSFSRPSLRFISICREKGGERGRRIVCSNAIWRVTVAGFPRSRNKSRGSYSAGGAQPAQPAMLGVIIIKSQQQVAFHASLRAPFSQDDPQQGKALGGGGGSGSQYLKLQAFPHLVSTIDFFVPSPDNYFFPSPQRNVIYSSESPSSLQFPIAKPTHQPPWFSQDTASARPSRTASTSMLH